MKALAKISLAFLIGTASNALAWDEGGWASTFESIAAFESRPDGNPFDINGKLIYNRPGYVKPIIDNLGNVLNSNWFASATVSKVPGFEAGIPISLIFIGDDDKKFNEYGMEVPTIFGGHADLSQDPFVLATGPQVYGNKTMSGLALFTYPYLQVAGNFYHARLVLRGMWLPSISELQKFNLFGIGAQYSFGHLFQYMLPSAAQPLDVSVVLGYSTSGISYQPEDYSGTLDLDIDAFTFDVVIGYKPVFFVEVMMTLGYQYANMASSGQLICNAKDMTGMPAEHFGEVISPNISVEGKSGFKFGLEVAFSLGSAFHPVVGFDYAGKSSFTLNALYFKQEFGEDKTPDEIAKEKGYVRGASAQAPAADKTESAPDANEDDNNAPDSENEPETPAPDESLESEDSVDTTPESDNESENEANYEE